MVKFDSILNKINNLILENNHLDGNKKFRSNSLLVTYKNYSGTPSDLTIDEGINRIKIFNFCSVVEDNCSNPILLRVGFTYKLFELFYLF